MKFFFHINEYNNKEKKITNKFKLFIFLLLFISNEIYLKSKYLLFVKLFTDLIQKLLIILLHKNINLNLFFKIFGDYLLSIIQKLKFILNLYFESKCSFFDLFSFFLYKKNTLYAGKTIYLLDYSRETR